MNIIEIFFTLMMACNQVPDKCSIVEDVEKQMVLINICNEKLKSSHPTFDLILFSKDIPEESRHILINTECTYL